MKTTNILQVTSSTSDWTTESIVNLLLSQRIEINSSSPQHNTWSLVVKSRFIESLILGFPIPQIVLATSKEERNKLIVVDGNKRLSSILEFYGESETEDNGFALTGLEFRKDSSNFNYKSLEDNVYLSSTINDLNQQSIRAIVIRDWSDDCVINSIYSRLHPRSIEY